MDVPLWGWGLVLFVIVVMLAVDVLAHRDAHEIAPREALTWTTIWVISGLTFGLVIWWAAGSEFAEQYYAGFLIEKSLAVDNVFVWAIIFASLGIPSKFQHRILFLGVLGALIFRGALIAAGGALVKSFDWVLYIFAAVLIVTAIQMLRHRDDHSNPTEGRVYRWLTRVMPTTDVIYGQRFLVRAGATGAIVATPLFVALILVELTDIVFAFDSIPAIFAVTSETFIVFTSNAFALLGLRAMYFLLADLMDRFVYLKLGLAAILGWVGVKLALHSVVKIDTAVSLAVIIVILAVSIGASLIKTRGQGRHHIEVEKPQHWDEATPEQLASARTVFTRKPLS
ncbi:MAG TPA: TerC family protein [Microbacteriaceae bacterium]|nr:TerC family protein [Microbacteriaceae bacterium]